VYDQARNELHRDSCPRVGAGVIRLPDEQALELVWAPKICSTCRPDVTMALGAWVAIGSRRG
jgi:ribosomal protein S27AE